MPLYFVQHGLALAKDVDPKRPLSAEGRRQVESIAAHLRRMEVEVKKIYHSGKTRAQETAQIFAEHIGEGKVYELSGMGPNDNVIQFTVTLKEDNAMYVGHLPHMGKLVSYLTTGKEDAGVVTFINAGVVCVEKDDTGFYIKWYLTPMTCKV
jgi:phosphohistidine phosphatase